MQWPSLRENHPSVPIAHHPDWNMVLCSLAQDLLYTGLEAPFLSPDLRHDTLPAPVPSLVCEG